jgi:secreted trypsin-like serine protease
VGKYYQQYNDPRDLNGTQYSTISDMFVPKKYKADVQNYVGDIAVIVTSKTLEFSTRVQPVCVDWTNTYQHAISNPRRGQMGYVTGWGYTSQNAKQLSDNLKSLTVPLVNEDDCYRNVPENFIQFLTDDKLCAGFLKSGMSLCQGDSGGGLVVKFENRYHIAAVASLGVLSETGGGECDSSQYNVYTLFADYIDFVSDKLAQYPPLGSEGLLISKSDFPRCVTTDTSTITK